MWRFAPGFLIGLACGGLLSSLLGGRPASDEDARARAEVEALTERISGLEAQLHALERETRWGSDPLGAAGGAAGAWPGDTPEALEPTSFEASLEAPSASLGGELAGVDCSEYPCVAAVGWPDGLEGLALLSAVEALQAGLQGDALRGSARTSRHGRPDAPGSIASVTVIAAWQEGDDVAQRVDLRGQELLVGLSNWSEQTP